MSRSFRSVLVLFFAIALPLSAAATSGTLDSAAAVVRLRTNCGSSPDNANCVETVAELTATGTTGWIWATRNPSASAPLLVDVGPGTFTGTFKCDGTGTSRGYVTLRGSGREQSIIKGTTQGVKVTNCKNLSFIDLGVQADRYGVVWEGSEGGSSSWSNVDIVGLGASSSPSAGWVDQNCSTQTARSIHYFHGSRIRGTITSGFDPAYVWAMFSQCSENWFFGGEIFLDLNAGSHSGQDQVILNDGGFLEVFGTAIRGRISGSRTTGGVQGIQVSNGPGTTLPVAFHSHGANIGLTTSGASMSVVAIIAADDAMVHAPGTAYALTPGSSGSATRVLISSGTPHVMAPFQWAADTSPPAVTSVDGEDMYVETDCNSSNCSSGTQPHLMIYSSACTSSPWWDVARNACRQ
jgi:hypothetical protein